MENIYVFGHKNPDTDSICSAIGYAYFKNQVDHNNNYIPIRLGDINNETKYVLDYFKQDVPEYMAQCKTQVSDIVMPKGTFVKENDSIKDVFEHITQSIGRTIAVTDASEKFIGLVSITDLLPLYFSPYTPTRYKDAETTFRNVIDTLELKLCKGTVIKDIIVGNVYLNIDIQDMSTVEPYDIVIYDYRTNIAQHIQDTNIKHIIIGNYNNDAPIDLSNIDATIFTTDLSIAEILKSLNHAIPISTVVQKENLVYFTTYETIEDVKENMLTSKHRRFPVVDESGHIKGTISRSNLIDINRKKAILVDHNENAQSITGLDSMSIVEVIDHHRVADISTMAPLYFRVEPVGCTCTIVAKLFQEKDIAIPKYIAGLLLSAILSDTLIFNSPTCTDVDKEMAQQLALIAGVDLKKYGRLMIDRGASLEGDSYHSILTKDMKRFTFGSHKVTISQVNTNDFDQFFRLFPNIFEELEKHCVNEDNHLSILMLTDLVLGGTELLAAGESKHLANEAFKMLPEDRSIFLLDVFSRKKQVVPKLMQAAHL